MPEENEEVHDSPPSDPLNPFWLDQGKKMLEESLPSIREAAKSLMTGLGLLTSVYLAILGFADFVPKGLAWTYKILFFVPLLFWFLALHSCLSVMMTKEYDINLHSPDDIREKSEAQLRAKQGGLQLAFWLLAAGLVVALLLVVFRAGFSR